MSEPPQVPLSDGACQGPVPNTRMIYGFAG